MFCLCKQKLATSCGELLATYYKKYIFNTTKNTLKNSSDLNAFFSIVTCCLTKRKYLEANMAYKLSFEYLRSDQKSKFHTKIIKIKISDNPSFFYEKIIFL